MWREVFVRAQRDHDTITIVFSSAEADTDVLRVSDYAQSFLNRFSRKCMGERSRKRRER